MTNLTLSEIKVSVLTTSHNAKATALQYTTSTIQFSSQA